MGSLNTTHQQTTTPRQRRHDARTRQIMDVALTIAHQDGWAAVTTRRLAEAIDYSQPVLYQHFTTRGDLLRAIAVEGFTTLTGLLTSAVEVSPVPLEAIARAYLDFATAQPRLYEVMFSLPTTIRFDHPDTPPALRDTFDALTAVIHTQCRVNDPHEAAEFFWAACHGLSTLAGAGRIPTNRLDTHITRLIRSTTSP